MKLTEGMKFKSRWFIGIVTVLSIQERSNILEVEITSETGGTWREEWDLHHTIWGFESNDYTFNLKWTWT